MKIKNNKNTAKSTVKTQKQSTTQDKQSTIQDKQYVEKIQAILVSIACGALFVGVFGLSKLWGIIS